MELRYSDGIAAARTMIGLARNAAALQRRLSAGWELAPYAGDDLRGTSLRGANMLVPFPRVGGLLGACPPGAVRAPPRLHSRGIIAGFRKFAVVRKIC